MGALQTIDIEPPATAAATPPTCVSFELLYMGTRDALYAYVMGLLRDRDSAEEVTAQAFERAYRKRARIDRARGDARAWLFGIARNAALDELRRVRRHALPVDPSLLAGLAGPGDRDADDVEGRVTLQMELARLSTRDRELVALKFYAGLNNREIAAILGLSESNVGTRLSRVITELRGAL